MNVPLFVSPPLNVTAELPVLFHKPLAAIEVRPVNILVPAVLLRTRLPLVPLPTVVAPPTVRLNPPTVKIVPSLITRLLELLLSVRAAPVLN